MAFLRRSWGLEVTRNIGAAEVPVPFLPPNFEREGVGADRAIEALRTTAGPSAAVPPRVAQGVSAPSSPFG